MEALLAVGPALGIVANLIEFTGVLAKVIHRINAYRGKLEYAPKIIRDIDNKSILLRKNVQRAGERASTGTTAYSQEDREDVKNITDACSVIIEKDLLPLLDKVLPTIDDSKLRRGVRAVRSVKHEEELSKTWARIESYEQRLANFTVLNSASDGVLKHQETVQPLFSYPARSASNYVERSQDGNAMIKLIVDHMAASEVQGGNPAIAVLLGMGGAGKTQLALRYCRELRNNNVCKALVWIDASSTASVAQSFQAIARTWAVDAMPAPVSMSTFAFPTSMESSDTLQQTVAAVIQSLERRSPWAMVFDNYDRIDDFEARGTLRSIRDYWPQSSEGQVLITSRNHQCERLGKVFDVGRLSEPEAIQLLQSRISLESNSKLDSHVAELVRKLGCLALAIDQAGAYIRSQRLTVQQYLGHYSDRRVQVLRRVPKTRDWEYQRSTSDGNQDTALSVFTTWEMSLNCLSGDTEERAQKIRFLSLAGFLDPLNLHEDLFCQGALKALETPAWATVFVDHHGWDPYSFGDVLSELRDLSLLESFDRNNTGCRLSIHPLVSEWIKLRLPREMQSKTAIDAAWLVRSNMPKDITESNDGKTVAELETLATHVSTCVQNCREFLPKDEILGVGRLETLGTDFTAFFSHMQMLEVSKMMCVDSLEFRKKYNQPWDNAFLLAGYRLVFTYQWRSEFQQAISLCSELVTAAGNVLGETNELTLRCASQLGATLTYAGRLDEAEQALRKAYDKQRRLTGPHRSWTWLSLANLARVYYFRGDTEQALSYGESAYQELRRVYGSDDAATLEVELFLLATYSSKDSKLIPEDLLDRSHQCVTRMEKRFGTSHSLTIGAYLQLAHAYCCSSQMDEAFGLLYTTLRVVESTSIMSPLLGDVYFQMALAAFRAGKDDLRSKYWEAAFQTYRCSGQMLSIACLNACKFESSRCKRLKEFAVGEALWQEVICEYKVQGNENPALEEIIYWGLYWLLAEHARDEDASWNPAVKDYLCKALEASRGYRQCASSVIDKLRIAIHGFALLEEGELVDITSGHLLQTWEDLPQYQACLGTVLDEMYMTAVQTTLPGHIWIDNFSTALRVSAPFVPISS